jgi:hypothetical protein
MTYGLWRGIGTSAKEYASPARATPTKIRHHIYEMQY